MNDMYSDGTYLSKFQSWHIEDSPWKAIQIMRGISVAGIQPMSVCDVGCGAGEIVWELANMMSQEVRLMGFEPSPQASALHRPYHDDRVHFIQGDFLKDSAERFDLLLAIDVFEHVPDYFGFLQTLRQRGDYAVFHIPLELTVLNLLHPSMLASARNIQGHLHFFDRESALAALRGCGYTILCEFFTNWINELPHRQSRQPLLSKVVAASKIILGEHMTVQLLGGHSLLVVARC